MTILLQKITTFLPFILGAPNSYYPRERKEGRSRGWKWGKGNLPKVNETQRFLWPWGIQTGPFSACEADFVANFSTFLPLILGGPISYFPRERKEGRSRGWKWVKGNHPKVNESQGFQYLLHSNWTICCLLSQICSLNFPTPTSLYWGVQFLLPQREECWKWENGILPTWVRYRGLSAWGIQTGPFATC